MSAANSNRFKIVQLNAENLFLFFDQPRGSDFAKMTESEWQALSHSSVANKPLYKVLWLAGTLLDIKADVIAMSEVGGEESLRNFATYFLHDLYTPYILEGNSDRGIDVGYLVKKTSALTCEVRSHKNRPIHFLYPHEINPNPKSETSRRSHYFSRDCLELRISSEPFGRPKVVMLNVHLKSKLDPQHIDPEGRERRRAEFNTLLEIYNETRSEFDDQVPVIVLGDFNGSARRDRLSDEFKKILDSDLVNITEELGLSGEQSATQLQFSRSHGALPLQIDFIFVSPDLRAKLVRQGDHIYRYRSDLRVPLNLPTTLEQRLYLPSDHYPVIAEFSDLF